MFTIWKYPIEIVDEQVLETPWPSTFLKLLVRDGVPTLYFEVFDDKLREPITIIIRGTGHPIDVNHWSYLDSFQQGQFVWHVYQKL